jgi:phage-related minor tail protein
MAETDDWRTASDTTDRLADTLSDLNGLSKSFGTALSGALKGAVLQGRELDSVLRTLALRLSGAALDAALKPVTSGIASGLSGLFSGLVQARLGAALSGGRVMPFAAGGVVAEPTFFPLAGGRTGLMGEAGPEAIMPLRRGADGRLGVAIAGGGAAPVSITFNVQTPDAESFRRSEAQIYARLARAVGRGRRGL